MSAIELQINLHHRGLLVGKQLVLTLAEDQEGFIRERAPLPVGTQVVVSLVDEPNIKVAGRVIAVQEERAGVVQPGGMKILFEESVALLRDYQKPVAVVEIEAALPQGVN